MKKYLIFIVTIFMVAIMAFGIGCGTYTPPVYSDPDEDNSSTKDPNGSGNEDGDIITGGLAEGYTFTVNLVTRNSEGQLIRYIPTGEGQITAQWKGENGIYSNPFNITGTATIILDGDYTVSLSNLPTDSFTGEALYTYDPNGLTVTNSKRTINIELLKIIPTKQAAGRGLYVNNTGNAKIISISESGAYKVTLSSTYTENAPWKDSDGVPAGSDIVYFEYRPPTDGSFLVESIVDVTENNINPSIWMNVVCQANYKNNQYTWEFVEDGGAEGTYTKNFRYQINLDAEYLNNVMAFGVCAETSKVGSDAWPVEFYFRVLYIGAYSEREVMVANGPFYEGAAPSGTWRWSYEDNPKNGTHYVLDGINVDMRFKLDWEDLDGDGQWSEWVDLNGNGVRDPEEVGAEGDGFYHLYDPVAYASNRGYGPLLWANIWGSNQVFNDGNHLTGTFAFPTLPTPRDYDNMFWQVYYGYGKALPNSNGTANQNGDKVIHPVNKEIMEALQVLVVSNRFFYDGEGTAETGLGELAAGNIFDTYNDYMFLVVCGYFV